MIKRTTLLIAIVALTFQLKAQINSIPNAGFESWTSMGSYEVPNDWGNLNASTASSSVYTVVKASPGSPGNHYIKITTKNVGGVITPGIIVSGVLDPVTRKAVSGFPFNQQVKNLKGKYQYMGYGTDVATFDAWLTRWNNVLMRRDTVATLHHNTSGMLHVWTPFSFPFTYTSTELPDTAIIYISSSSSNPVLSSFIWLDDLGFEGTVTAANGKVINSTANIYPCPASDQVTIDFTSKGAYSSPLKLVDSRGKAVVQSVVNVSAGFNSLNLGLQEHNLLPGLYYVQLQTPEGILSGKVVIGKF